MFEVFKTVFTQMTGIVAVLIVGYLLNRRKVLLGNAASALSKLSTTLLLPALNLYTCLSECTPENFSTYWTYILVGGVCIVVSVGISVLISRFLSPDDRFLRNVYTYNLAIPNTGSVGTPLILALYGTSGLFKYSLFLFVLGIITYSWGISLLVPHREKRGLLAEIRGFFSPPFIGTLIGCFLGLTGLKDYLPNVISETVQKVGNCYSPIVLLTTGFVVGNYGIKEMLTSAKKSSYVVIALRLVVLPLLFLAGAKLLHASAELTTMIIFTYACSTGMNPVIYPTSYGSDPRPGAQQFLVSTFIALVTVPLISMLI